MSYKSIFKFYESCYDRYGDCPLGVDWPKIEDVDKRYNVMLDIIKDKSTKATLLDFGCGLSHLYEYLLHNNITSINYSGLDISEKFTEASKKKFPNITYYNIDLLSDNHLELPLFDYIIMNGIFTEKRDLSHSEMFGFLCKLINKVFTYVEIGIAFNVMSPVVDWYDDKLFYLSIDQILEYICKNLSRHVIIRHDYGLYEYTIYVYKEMTHPIPHFPNSLPQ